jgi:hypothetical protein
VLDALYWDGNAVAGAQTARELARSSDRVTRNNQEREEQSRDLCVVEQWRLAHGDTTRTRASMQRLRAVREDLVPSAAPNAVCAAVLEAWVATIGHHAGATALLDRLDSLLLTGVGDGVGLPPNIVVSRLREALGDRQGALRAIRRRMYGFQPLFLSTYLREEGRLAALTGDTAAAISAYRRYLALRSDPEAELRPQVARIRDALAELVAK